VRVVHLWQIQSAPFFTTLLGDSKTYDAWAREIARGNWVGTDTFYQAPLYPYFLGALYSLFGPDLFVVRLVQAVAGSAACVLLALAGSRWFSKPIGLAAGTGLALYAPMIFADALIQKSVLDVLLMCATLWLAGRVATKTEDRPGGWLMLGGSVGLLSLTRENSLAVTGVIVIWLLASRSRPGRARVATAGAFLIGVAMMLLPVATRNASVGGEFVLTTAQFGPNFYIGNHAGADGTYTSLRFGRGDAEYERQDAVDLAEQARGRPLSPREVSAYWAGQAFEYIRSEPADWSALVARKIALLWNATEMLDTESQATHAEHSRTLDVLGSVAHFGVLAPLAFFGVWVTWHRRRDLSLFYLMLLAYAASVVVFYVFARYRYPLVPFLMLLAAAAGVGAVRVFRERPRPQMATALVATVGFTVFCNWPLLSADLMRAITENNLATALREGGHPDQAEAHYRRAIEIAPDYAAAYSNLGALVRAEGRVNEAIAQYREALRLQPDHVSAQYNLGNALLAAGRPGEAADHFRRAVEREPGSAEAWNNLGIALAAQGRPDDAAQYFRRALAIAPTAEGHHNLGNVLADLGHVEEAISELGRAIAAQADYFPAHYDLGRLLIAHGPASDAVDVLRRAVALDPRSADAHNNLGIALASAGRLAEAIEEFEQALRVTPDHVEARRNLSLAHAAVRR
jgi:tetratricopeptide (TPR) repeat protein